MTLVTVAATVTSAGASTYGDVGNLSYNVGSTVYVAAQDGSGAKVLATDVVGKGAWSPDGSRFAYLSTDGSIKTVRYDGGPALTLTDPYYGTVTDPTWNATGDLIYYESNRQLKSTSSDGTFYVDYLGGNPESQHVDVNPSVSLYGDVIFEREGAIYKWEEGGFYHVKLIDDGTNPDFAPDGERFVYLAAGDLWIADIDGGNRVQLTTGGDATDPAYAPDGESVVYATTGAVIKRVDVASKQVSTVKSGGTTPVLQGLQRDAVNRVWGNDGTETAIATSQRNFGDGDANAVVLSRSDTYLDALVGSALAVNEHAPLLITKPGNTVEARVLAEIKRVLGSTGTIYLLGGTLALPQGIQTQLKNLGYQVTRLWGATHFETAIAIDQQITGGETPAAAIVTTGANYYDALAAGAAAGANPGTVIVLTDGEEMPDVSADYLNHLNPDYENGGTLIVTAGGPGDTALLQADLDWPNGSPYYPLVGDNEMDTAIALASFFFAAPFNVALSTNRGWQDALTGGAMIGGTYGPLLLTDPDQLYGPVAQYLSEGSGSIHEAVMLGGYLALPDALIAPIGDSICVAGHYDYNPHDAAAAGRSAKRSLAAKRTTTSVPGVNKATPKLYK
ncbi:cell wall-binding repeat-containing protein [Dactylosporangium aurantiacum]|uniref:Cell wall-binding repeat-containing protein n=1 Tax=Dactylosporangium aurantiacum TaxID=35754 RepID=A0A9Q9IKK7_9ACTN|nr:cell wall-binding repeat-containing protein [Dactylosporangium aurantiacum]MDG6100857.1 cell wall-binding repeat-containing protein [Dactylosporangium aurantiacum]UWZ55084.1 cell wall-binding repeat-containing protein [Dactylosporangium aurantiacum]